MKVFALCVICGLLSFGQSLQKTRTFYPLDSQEMPDGLKTGARSAVASDGAEWKAAARGLYRGPEFFAGKRYLPDDEVLALAPDAARGMWVRTRTGIAHIQLLPMTLAEKASIFEARVAARHDRYGMTADSHLAKAGD